MNGAFEMKDLGAAKTILEMEIHRDRKCGKLCISQKNYIERVVECFGMIHVKPVITPLTSHIRFSAQMSPQTEDER